MIELGIDTQKQSHVAVALDSTGQVLSQLTIEVNSDGYKQLVNWSKDLPSEHLHVGIAQENPLEPGAQGGFSILAMV